MQFPVKIFVVLVFINGCSVGIKKAETNDSTMQDSTKNISIKTVSKDSSTNQMSEKENDSKTTLQKVVMDSSVNGFYLEKVQQYSLDSFKIKNPGLTHNYNKSEDVYLLNKDSSQIFVLIFHPGDSKGEFAEYEVKKCSDKNAYKYSEVTSYKNFISSLNIKLGDSIGWVMKQLPKENVKTVSISSILKRVSYNMDGIDKYLFLYQYNMPSYYADYDFTDGILTRFRFGFEYP